MSITAEVLLGLVAWTIILGLFMMVVRMIAISKGKPINEFDITGKDLGGMGHRVTRAHGNSIENLAVTASLLLYAIATNQTEITNGLACWLLLARIGQSVVHILSASQPMVMIRATLYATQITICAIWIWKFLHV